jgi:hypothetical protein
MERTNNPSPVGNIDVRYDRSYSIIMLALMSLFVALAIYFFGKDWADKTIFIIIGLLSGIHGIYALMGKKYLRFDPQGKRIIFFGLFGLVDRKVRYDRIYMVGKEIYRKINGKTRFINIIYQQCNKEDYQRLVDEIIKRDTSVS